MYSKIAKVNLLSQRKVVKIPFFASRVKCGFPSPAEDYTEQEIDFNRYLIKREASTFTIKVEGESMIDQGIQSGDMLIVDRSITPQSGMIVVAALSGEFTVKTFYKKKEELWLYPGNKNYTPIQITQDMDFMVWGVVSHIIHHCKIS